MKRIVSALSAAAALAWCAAAPAAEVKVVPYGVTKDGRKVTAYTLVNDRGASATVLDFGGKVTAIRVPDRDGKLGNTVQAFQDLAGWESSTYTNALTGRYAGTITKGFTLDGVYYPLVQTAEGTTMHGGVLPYATRIWLALPIRKADGAAVTLTLDSPDGDQGFPGRLKIAVKYSFTNDDALRLDFIATTDEPTVLNLMNHMFFNLNGNSAASVYTQELQVFTDQGPSRTPGVLAQPLVGTPLDFTKPALIGDRVAGSLGPQYDDPSTPLPPGMARGLGPFLLHDGDNRLDRIALRMRDPASGRVLEIRTTEPQILAFMPSARRTGEFSDAGKPFVRGQSVSFETQHLSNSPNRPEFPSTVLRPGQTFKSSTIYAFSTDTNLRKR
jgi:aldose 1-epimerase